MTTMPTRTAAPAEDQQAQARPDPPGRLRARRLRLHRLRLEAPRSRMDYDGSYALAGPAPAEALSEPGRHPSQQLAPVRILTLGHKVHYRDGGEFTVDNLKAAVLHLQLPEGGALMARSYGRLFTSIWNDEDFRPLSVGAKLMYGFLISQDDIEHSGIIPFRPPRWAQELGEPAEDVIAWLKELDEAGTSSPTKKRANCWCAR